MATYLENYPQSISDGQGLISQLSEITSIPWNTLDTEAKQYIERLYGVRSGFKTIVTSFQNIRTEILARMISSMFSEKWTRLWNDYIIQYNPLDAYSLIENSSSSYTKESEDAVKYGKTENQTTSDGGTLTKNTSDTLTHGRSTTENGTDTGTVETSGTDNSNATDSIYGFNSTNSVPSGSGTEQNTSSATENRDLATSRTMTNSGTDNREIEETENRNLTNSKDIVNSGQDERTGIEESNESFNSTKKGNIGYTTPQELLKQDIELWSVPFFSVVFSDIDSFMMLSVY